MNLDCTGIVNHHSNDQPRPQGFSLKKMGGASSWWGHPFFKGKALGTRLSNDLKTKSENGLFVTQNF